MRWPFVSRATADAYRVAAESWRQAFEEERHERRALVQMLASLRREGFVTPRVPVLTSDTEAVEPQKDARVVAIARELKQERPDIPDHVLEQEAASMLALATGTQL